VFTLSPSPYQAVDDTRALQGAIASMDAVQLSAGVFIVSDTIWIQNKAGLLLRGSGKNMGAQGSGSQGTKIVWKGNSTDPLFRISNSRDCVIENFVVESSPSFPLAAAFLSENPLGGAFGTTGNVYRDLYLNGGNTNGLQKGFQFVPSGNDANNDASRFENVFVNNYTTAAWSFEHAQSKAHVFIGCTFGGFGGQYGVTTALGAGGVGGSLSWYGGGGGSNTVADFYLGAPNDAILISNANCESSNRFLLTTGPTTGSWPVVLEGCRFSGDTLNADGKAVIFQSVGPLTIVGCDFGDGANGAALQIYLNPSSSGFGVAIGNQIFSSLLHPFTISGSAAWSLTGNVQALNNANTLIS